MDKIILNGSWVCTMPDSRTFDVNVPGCFDNYVEEKDIAEEVHFTKKIAIQIDAAKKYYLFFGGVSYYCDIFVNGKPAGSHEGMWDNFRINITKLLQDGENTIEAAVTKPGYGENDRFKVREVLSGFIPDVLHTFGGIWDDAYIETCNDFLVTSYHAKGDMTGNAELVVNIDAAENSSVNLSLDVYSPDNVKVYSKVEDYHVKSVSDNSLKLLFKLDNPMLWDTHTPNLYSYTLTVSTENETQSYSKKLGFRDIESKGTDILLNGKPVYTRGILHWGYYDEELVPNPTREQIKDEIAKVKAMGFNMIKHCLYIPREDYFELADEEGVLLWVELPLWLADVTPELIPRIEYEYPRIINQISGHPSIIIMSLGCELDAKVDSSILEEMYHLAKKTSNALIRDNSGSGECYDGLSVDYADFFDYHFYGDLHNMENLMENFTPSWRSYRPWIYGEFCDSDTMRDLKEFRELKHVDKFAWESEDVHKNPICALKPDFHLGKHDERMEKSGIRKNYEHLKKLSINHAMSHRKTTLEYTRGFPEISGYNITCIRDVPIATSGIMDDMMNLKFDAELWKEFNGDIALVPAWDLTRVWINADRVMSKERYNFFGGDYYGLHVILSNYSGDCIEMPQLNWNLICGEKIIASGKAKSDKCYVNGEVSELSYISINLPEVDKPQTFVLSVEMACRNRTQRNKWPVFVYPKPQKNAVKVGLYDPANLFTSIETLYDVEEIADSAKIENVDMVMASRLTNEVLEYAKNGGKVLYMQNLKGSLPSSPVPFWREGMVECYKHKILDGIDYEEWFDDLRFYSVAAETAFDTDKFAQAGFAEFETIIKRYDCRTWLVNDYMTEIKVGEGTIIATTLKLNGGAGKQPLFISNNKFGRWLINSIIEYLG